MNTVKTVNIRQICLTRIKALNEADIFICEHRLFHIVARL